MKTKDILNLYTDVDGLTIKEYFKELLITLWKEGESFSSKRPFGNSGWEYDLYKPLIAIEVIEGKIDEYGYVEEINIKKADEFIINLIEIIFKGENDD